MLASLLVEKMEKIVSRLGITSSKRKNRLRERGMTLRLDAVWRVLVEPCVAETPGGSEQCRAETRMPG